MRKDVEEQLHPEGLSERQEQLVLALYNAGVIAFNFEEGWLLSHHDVHPDWPRSPFYIDCRLLQSEPDTKDVAVAYLIDLTEGLVYDRIAGIPEGAVPIASSMTDITRKPQITPRKPDKTHGNQGYRIDGKWKTGDIALGVDDLITGGTNKKWAMEILNAKGLIVLDMVVLFDRQQGGKEALAEMGVTLHAALDIKPTFQFLARIDKINQEELQQIFDYLAFFENQ